MNQTQAIKQLLYDYVSSGLVDRDPIRVLRLVSDEVIGIGMGEQGFVTSKKDVKEILEAGIREDDKAKYELEFERVEIQFINETTACVCAQIIIYRTDESVTTKSSLLQSLTVRLEGKKWLVCALHASPMLLSEESIEAYPLHYARNSLAYLKAELQTETFELVNQSIPGGIVCLRLEPPSFPLYFVNDSVLEYMGYTREEFYCLCKNGAIEMIHPIDRVKIRNLLDIALQSNDDIEARFRIIKKDGSSIWMVLRGRKSVDETGKDIMLGVMMDVTELILLQNELEEHTRALSISEERFRIALEKTTNIIFDYDLISGNIMHSSAPKKAHDFVTNICDASKTLIIGGTVMQESMEAFYGAFQAIQDGEGQAECVVKVKMTSGIEVWHKISITAVYDESGITVRAIGMIEDITRQKEAELALQEKAQRDPLTGVLNKAAAADKIKEQLQTLEGIQSGVFMMIDVDLFKNINDSYGHPFGDKVLQDAAAGICSRFRENDVVARFGGDEFAVFFMGFRSRCRIEQAAEEICDIFRNLFSPGTGENNPSCSIGVALCQGESKSFEQIYKEADEALYHAKKAGRNRYVIYQ